MLGRLSALLLGDERVLAVWLGGSFGRGTTDALSDLDVFCMTSSDQFEQWLDDRPALYRRLGLPLLTGPDQASMVASGGRSQSVLLSGPVSVDLEAYPQRAAIRMPDTRVLFERNPVPLWQPPEMDPEQRRREMERQLGFFWAMAPIAIKYIARGATDRAVTQIDLLTGAFVALWRLVHDSERAGVSGSHWLRPDRDADLIRDLPRLGSVIDPEASSDVVQALIGEVIRLEEALAAAGVAIPSEAIQETVAFAGLVNAQRRPATP